MKLHIRNIIGILSISKNRSRIFDKSGMHKKKSVLLEKKKILEMYTGYSNFHQNYFLQMIRVYKGFLDHPLKFGSEKSRYMLRNNLNPNSEIV